MTDHISGTSTSYATEFPDFDPATMPPIPDGWLDTSWHNDACPSFNTNTGFQVFVDFADPALREWSECERFTVHLDPETHDANDPVHSSNDWNDVLAFLVGEQFAADLKQDLGEEKFAEMKRKNETDPAFKSGACCASHDYCDANMVMSDAFTAVMCRPPVMGEEGRDAEEQADIALWNAAWEYARKRHSGHQPEPVG